MVVAVADTHLPLGRAHAPTPLGPPPLLLCALRLHLQAILAQHYKELGPPRRQHPPVKKQHHLQQKMLGVGRSHPVRNQRLHSQASRHRRLLGKPAGPMLPIVRRRRRRKKRQLRLHREK